MKKILKYIVIILLLILIFSYLNYKSAIDKSFEEGDKQIFIIEKGEGLKNISANLKKENLIISEDYFEIYVRLSKLDSKLQAGEYLLNPSMSIKDIAKRLSEGLSLSQEKTIKIIEGWNISDISNYLQKEINSSGFYDLKNKKIKDYLSLLSENSVLRDISAEDSLEGYFFPDTYRIFNEASLDDVVLKSLNNFNEKISLEMKEDIKKQGKSLEEIIAMASLIEKEVRSAEDMKIVSGIFWNRIEIGQALESCATLAYILGENKKQYTYEDTEIKSSYNTYKNPGLPPGPIANPGLNAIQAAVYPEKTNYYYFLSRADDGETVFSKTYDEHLKNKAKYLQ
jgi:UPF0755 protein